MFRQTLHALRLPLLAAGLAAGAALALPWSAEAAPRTVTISVLHPAGKPQVKIWYRFRDIVEEKLPGQFEFNIVPDAALGGERETAEGVRLGSIDGGMSTLANLGTWVPEVQLFDLPFIFRDEAHVAKVVDGPIGQQFSKDLAAQGFRVLGYVIYGKRNVLSVAPVRTPDDVKDKSMRVIQSPLHVGLWKTIGARPTPLPITEAYTALETGVVSVMDFTTPGYESYRLYEVAPNLTATGHIWSVGVMYFGEDFWQSLTPEQQSAFQAAADVAVPYFNEINDSEEKAALDRLKAKGVTYIVPDRAAWQEAARPFWKDYAPKVGGMDKIEAVVETE